MGDLHFDMGDLHSHFGRHERESQTAVVMPITATITPTSVRMASLDQLLADVVMRDGPVRGTTRQWV